MKKFIVPILCTLLTSYILGEENKSREELRQDREEAIVKEEVSETSRERDLSDSFTAAFGMETHGSPSLSSGMAAGSATAVNQVTTPFTPHMPK